MLCLTVFRYCWLIVKYSSHVSAEKSDVPADWPRSGCISYSNVTLKISPNEESIITEANFTVSSGDKVVY